MAARVNRPTGAMEIPPGVVLLLGGTGPGRMGHRSETKFQRLIGLALMAAGAICAKVLCRIPRCFVSHEKSFLHRGLLRAEVTTLRKRLAADRLRRQRRRKKRPKPKEGVDKNRRSGSPSTWRSESSWAASSQVAGVHVWAPCWSGLPLR